MKIFIDARMINKAGIGRYLREILSNIAIIKKDISFYFNGDPAEIGEYVSNNKVFDGRNHINGYNVPIYSLKEPMAGSVLNYRNRNSMDLFFFPHYNAPFYMPENSVITIHDLIHFKFPQYFGKLKVNLAKIILRNGVKKAKKIIVDSGSTAKDLVAMFPAIREKIKVIHIGISSGFKVIDKKKVDNFKRKKKLDRYILYIGNKKAHKNLGGLVEAFLDAKRSFKDLKLVIIGKRFKDVDIKAMLKYKADAADIIELENIGDNEIIYYYNAASAFVFPSFYEGFGLPPLEAMACGCPVIASNASSLPEICGDGAYYVDPDSTTSIARGICEVLGDEDLQKSLIAKGHKRAGLFKWEEAARKTLNVFMETIDTKEI